MKILKFIVASAVLVFAGLNASAQTGIEAGYINTRYNMEGAQLPGGDALNGFYVGVSNETNLVGGLGIHIGLNYSYATDKAAKDLWQSLSMKGGTEKDQSLNVPLRLRFAFNLLPKILKIQIYGGPVFSLGLSHTQDFNFSTEIAGQSMTGSLKYNYYTGEFKSDVFDDDQLEALNRNMPAAYKRFDVAVGGGLGVELFRLLEVKAGYDWGVMNRIKGDAAQTVSCKKNMFYVTVGFRF